MNIATTELVIQGYRTAGEHTGWRDLAFAPQDEVERILERWTSSHDDVFDQFRVISRRTETQVFETVLLTQTT